jgi:D-alanyl-D-alanine carboxypeptidase
MAEMTRALIMEYPEVLAVASKYSVRFDRITYFTTNVLLDNYIGMDGMKTGFTTPAGYCFTGTAQRGDRRMISVTLGSTQASRFLDSRILLDYGFDNIDRVLEEYYDGIDIDDEDDNDIAIMTLTTLMILTIITTIVIMT